MIELILAARHLKLGATERASPKLTAEGGTMHILQLWVGLTAAHQEQRSV